MKDQDKTKEDFGEPFGYPFDSAQGRAQDRLSRTELLNELAGLRQRVAELEAADIEHKWAEEALRESEARCKALFDRTLYCVYVHDFEGRFLDANEAALNLLGYTKEEIPSLKISSLLGEDQLAKAFKTIEEIKQTGSQKKLTEYKLRKKDGDYVWVETEGSAICRQGKPYAIQGIARDITERKRAEEEIRQRTAQLEALRQVGLEITAELDLDALLRSIVSRAIELLGGTTGGLYLYRPERDVLEWSMAVGPHLAPIGTVLRRGEGLSGKVWETGEPLIVDDYQQWDGRAAIWEGYPLAAIVGAPVRWGEEFLGVLNVHTDTPRAFSLADAELLSLFATQAATAIRNARLYEETRQRALEQETVSRIAYALNTPDVRDAFPVLVKGLQDLTGCDRVSMMAIDEAGEQFIMTVLESPFAIPGEEEVMPLSATAAAEDVEAGRPHLTADLSTETHFPLEQALYQAGLRSQVTLPLLVGGEAFGALNLGGSDMGLFQEDQLPVLQQIADAVALALENSLLFQAERKQRERAEALEEATAALTATLDCDQVLDRILEQVGRVVPNDATNIMLIEGDQTRIARWRGYERFGAEEFVSTVVFHIPEVPNLQQMMESEEPMVIPDTATYPGWVQVPMMEWLRSYTGAPIIARGEVIGFLNVYSATPGFFTQAHAEALRVFADHAAVAIKNARLYRAEQERRHIAETLRQASTILSSTLELSEVLELILQQLRQVIPYDSASVQRLQDDKRLEIVACRGFEEPDKVVGLVFPLDPKFPNHRVVTTKAPLAIEDVVHDFPHFKDEADTYESGRIRSWLGVPLMVKDQVIGMIAIDRKEVHPYTAEEAQLAMAFANQAAIAIENARLYQEARQRVAELEALRSTSLQLTSSLDLPAVLDSIAESALSLVGATDCHIYLYDETSETFTFGAALWEDGRREAAVKIPRRDGLTASVARGGQPLVINDASHHPLYATPEAQKWGLQAIAGFPLQRAGQVLGVFTIAFIEPHTFSGEELRVLSLLADQAAIATENARLYEETRERATELGTLYEVTTAAMTSVHLDELLDQTMAAIQETLRPDDIAILLVEPETNELVIRAHTGFPGGPKLVRRSIGVGVPGRVAQTGQPVLLADVREDERYRACDPDTRSELCVPLRVGERIIGALNLESRRLAAFSEDDLRLLSILAGHLAAVIDNARLFEETERLKVFNESIVQGMTEGIAVEDVEGYFTFINPAAAAMLGYSPEELVGQHWTATVPPDQQSIVRAADQRRVRGEADRYELELVRKDGTRIPVLISGSPQFEEGRFAGTLAVFTDITERKRAEEQLAYMATHDPLTDLPNRVLFNDRFVLALAHAQRNREKLVVMLLDLDHFKDVNDTLGHSMGDKLLQVVGERLAGLLRKSDTIARMGGDEFMLLLPEIAEGEDVAKTAAKILEAFREPFEFDGHELRITTSIGIALYPEDGEDADTLMRNADIAMYRAKDQGRDNYQRYTPAMNAKALE